MSAARASAAGSAEPQPVTSAAAPAGWRPRGMTSPTCPACPAKLPPRRLKANPLDVIAQRVREGPLLLLKRCYAERRRVRVVTRHARGVRGTSEGAQGGTCMHNSAADSCCRCRC